MEKLIKYTNNINKIDENDYFVSLDKLTVKPSLTKFLTSQECFISAVDNWSKALGLMLFHVPTDKERLIIIKNLMDEHGEGDLTKSHTNTFKLLLQSLGYDKEILLYNDTLPSYFSVKTFNTNLMDTISGESWIYCVAMLGMIEYTYITVSKKIHNYLLNHLEHDKINHYSTHEIVDVTHATELFSLLIPHMIDGELSNDMKYGIHAGYNLMNQLYSSLNLFL